MNLTDIFPGLGLKPAKEGTRKEPSTTKRGPGREHHSGHKKASPIKSKGAGIGFVQHTASAAKRERRRVIAAIGIRQYKRRDRRGNAANVKGLNQTEVA